MANKTIAKSSKCQQLVCLFAFRIQKFEEKDDKLYVLLFTAEVFIHSGMPDRQSKNV